MITAENVGKVFAPRGVDEVVALNNVEFTIDDGEFVTVLGPSGCGKSTLLRLVAGLSRTSAGRVCVDGVEVTGPSRAIGVVFQLPILLRWRTVLDNVLLPAETLRLNGRAYREHALSLLQLAGLGGFEKHMPYQLSGGMQQRVALCRTLAFDPKVLLMDEPFGALDAMTREELSLELLRIWEQDRKTVLFITHSITEAILLGDRVIVMTPRPGRIAEVITVDLPRPRDVSAEYSPEFQRVAQHLRTLLGGSGKGEGA